MVLIQCEYKRRQTHFLTTRTHCTSILDDHNTTFFQFTDLVQLILGELVSVGLRSHSVDNSAEAGYLKRQVEQTVRTIRCGNSTGRVSQRAKRDITRGVLFLFSREPSLRVRQHDIPCYPLVASYRPTQRIH